MTPFVARCLTVAEWSPKWDGTTNWAFWKRFTLGHAYLGACLMSAGLKGRDRLRLPGRLFGADQGVGRRGQRGR